MTIPIKETRSFRATGPVEVEVVETGVELRIPCVTEPGGKPSDCTVALSKDDLCKLFAAVVDAAEPEEPAGPTFTVGYDEAGKPIAVPVESE